ncbi:MAG: PEP-CTERM sorting domain-containing protein [Phycisphaerales bacterium JB054]
MKNCTIVAIAGLAFAGAANAQVIMDFQDLESTGGSFTDVGTSYSANGFTVRQGDGEPFTLKSAHTDNATFYQGSTMLFNDTVDGVITLTQDNGNPFSMASIDIAGLFVGSGSPSFTFTGNLNGGGQVFANYAGGNAPQTFDFTGLGFTNLDSLSWTQSSQTAFHQFDNITIVPAPGAFALLGLGGLAAARRRRA